jgi:hypothetical protein
MRQVDERLRDVLWLTLADVQLLDRVDDRLFDPCMQ